MRRLRGLHVEDCYLTYRIVQKVFSQAGHIVQADSRVSFLDQIGKIANDFIIADGDLPGWPIEIYAADLRKHTHLPIFIYSSSDFDRLLALVSLGPVAIIRKSDGPMVLIEAIRSYFYSAKEFSFPANVPKPFSMS